MESTYYVLENIPDLTLNQYSSLDENGVGGVLARHRSFWRQMGRRGLLEQQDAFHLFYEYNPARPQGERLCVGIRFDTGKSKEEEYLPETLRSSALAPFYTLRLAGTEKRPGHPEKGCYPAPDISYPYRCSLHLIRKERMIKALSLNEDGNLSIAIENKMEHKEEDKKQHYLRREFSYTNYQQNYSLPEDVVKDKISARVENGILTVTLPKQEKEAKVSKSIEIS